MQVNTGEIYVTVTNICGAFHMRTYFDHYTFETVLHYLKCLRFRRSF